MSLNRLVIVEDHPATRNALRTIFARKGWEVAVAGTVAEGLALLDPPPSCLILDMMLPDGDGEAILRKVRADRLPTRVAVCTGMNDPDRLAKIRRLHPDSLLRKPISLADLYDLCAGNGSAG